MLCLKLGAVGTACCLVGHRESVFLAVDRCCNNRSRKTAIGLFTVSAKLLF